jgi:hypothetical protein
MLLKHLCDTAQNRCPQTQVLVALNQLDVAPVDRAKEAPHFVHRGNVSLVGRPVTEGIDQRNGILTKTLE